MVRRLVALVVIGVLLYLGGTFAQVYAAAQRDGADAAGAIVVLGAAQYDGRPSPVLQRRLDHAAALYRRDLAPIVVVTGGSKPGDRFTEAGAGASYLRRAGVPDAALRLEVDGTSSWESIAATARFLREEGVTDVLLVSDAYHSYRIAAIADEVGLDAATSPSSTSVHPAEAALWRETAAVALGRIVGYRRIHFIGQPIQQARSGVRTAVTGHVGGEVPPPRRHDEGAAMVKPQQPELARSRLGTTDKDGKELRVDEKLPEPESSPDPTPQANQPNAEHEEPDKPEVPPHERHDR